MGTISEKLTYLDETRENIRQSINSIGGDLTNSDTFRSYSDAIDEIYEKFPKVEGEGSNITLENTMEASIKSELDGDTSQDGTPTPDSPVPINVVTGRQEVDIVGKNLFNPATFIEKNNIYCSNEGVLTSDGFSYAAWNYSNRNIEMNLEQGTYSFSLNFSQVGTNSNFLSMRIFNSSGSQLGEIRRTNNIGTYTTTITLTSTTTIGIMFKLETEDIATYQIEKGQPTPYEEYKGQSYEINLGKNLIDLKDGTYTIANELTAEVENGEITLNGTTTANRFLSIDINTNLNLTNGEQYTISTNNSVANGNVRFRIEETGTLDTILSNVNATTTITYSNSYGLYGTVVRIRVASGTTLDNYVIKPQLEKGSQATSYSPYKTPIELCKIGTYQDRIYKENGTWYLHKEIGKVVFNGTENWTEFNPVSGATDTLSQIGMAMTFKTREGLSNNFNVIPNYNPTERIVIGGGLNRIYVQIENSRLSSVDIAGFKTWLSTHNTSLYYPLATPTTTEITDSELIEQLAEFGDAKSYEGTTNINVDGDLPIILNVKALEDIFSQ